MSKQTILLYSNKTSDAVAYETALAKSGLDEHLIVCKSTEEVENSIAEADIIFGVHLPPGAYKNARKLKWIQSMWAGVEGLVNAEFFQTPQITKPWGIFGSLLAHYVFGNLLAHKIRAFTGKEQQQRKQWKQYQIEKISGKTIGIAGIGDIGTELARVARAFDMQVWGLNRSGIPNATADRTFSNKQLEEFVSGTDVLVLALPLTSETRGMFNQEILEKLRPDSWIINVGRGPLIDDESLVNCLKSNKIAGAILDVFAVEPLPPEHPFWSLENCIVTPHIGGPSIPEEITTCFMENLVRYKNGQTLLGLVDLQRGY